MAEPLDLSNPPWAAADTIIDVRSPAEFAEDHVPGAINLPVLSNAERAQVGTIYVQESPFKARKIGAVLVARNAARHIETQLMDRDGGWRPLVYCWRGGQRSGAFASILQQIGWRAETLPGGYRAYRRAVVDRLYADSLPYRIVRLDGFTGTAKTEILKRLRAAGHQTLDLEGLSAHRGSALGAMDQPQPSQKAFESAVLQDLLQYDPDMPVFVEAESARIGVIRLPPALWAAMRDSPRIVVTAPEAARAAYLAEAYRDLTEAPEALAGRLDRLRPLVGHAEVAKWHEMAADGAFVDLAAALISGHYDRAYRRARQANGGPVLAELRAERLDEGGLQRLAKDVAEALANA